MTRVPTPLRMPSGASHTEVEHTGEMELVVRAPTLAALFAEGALALADVLVRSRPPGAERGPAESIRLTARDLPALWVAWLNELVFMSEVSGRVYWDADVHACDEDRLEAGGQPGSVRPSGIEATVRGTLVAHIDTAVKAATFHRLAIAEDERGWHAGFILDV